MRLDHIDVSWDTTKSNWLIRMEAGDEVIRRRCNLPKNADEQTLRSAVQKTVEDEGYESDSTLISIQH